MRKMFFIVLVLISASEVRAQNGKDECKTMVDSAIRIKYAAFKAGTKNQNNNSYFENLYLLNEQDQPLNYLTSSRMFKSIAIYDDRNRKAIAKGIYAWKVFTSLSRNRFMVTIVDFYITFKNHNYNFANGGGSETAFQYDCDKGIWKLVSSQTKGN